MATREERRRRNRGIRKYKKNYDIDFAMDVRMNFQSLIYFCRRDRGLTIAGMAKKINVKVKTIEEWENGEKLPDYNSLSIFCEVFKMNYKNVYAAWHETRKENPEIDFSKIPINKR